jgi:hypothetical protein
MRYIFVKRVSQLAVVVIGLLTVPVLSAASLTWVEDVPLSLLWKAMRIPKWSHGALIDIQYANNEIHPLIWVAERHRTTYTVPFEIPGARSINVYDWDRTFDGRNIALAGSAIDAEGRGDFFIAWISSDGTHSVVSRTSSYIPRRLTVAPDGTLWTAGQDSNGPPDAGVFRHFDQTGKSIGAFVPRSSFSDPIILYDHTGLMRASKDRVAWYSPRGSRYIEISLQGVVLMDISVTTPKDSSEGYGFGITDKGDAFLSSSQYVPPAGGQAGFQLWRISILDRSTATWKPVLERPVTKQTTADFGHIYGVDTDGNGDELVLTGDHSIKFYRLGK